jgi:hypothetical protein
MSKVVLYNLPILMRTATPGNSGNISWLNASTIALDIAVTGSQGTSPTLEVWLDRLGVDGVTYFNLWDSTILAPASFPKSVSIGPGCSIAQELGSSGQVRWAIGGSSSPGIQFSVSIQGE